MSSATGSQSTYVSLTGAVITYSSILLVTQSKRRSEASLRTTIKSISAGHSIVSTILTLTALSQPWITPAHVKSSRLDELALSNARLDDSDNPLIVATNQLAKHLTAWEAGYLIYDVGALAFEAYSSRKKSDGLLKPLITLVRKSPITLIHHVSLAGALLYLQTYISEQREKGLEIITAFLLMNASTPLVHLRWWRRKQTGRGSTTIDVAVAAAFALSRFGTIYWILKAYGEHHDLSPMAALLRQRWQCKAGTGMLLGLNLLWWLGFVRQMSSNRWRR